MSDNEAKIIPGRNGGTLRPVRDAAQASALVRQRWAKRAAAARAGLRDAARELTEKAGLTLPDGAPLANEYDVVRVLTTQHAVNAADPSARGAAQSMRLAVEGAFPKPEPDQTGGLMAAVRGDSAAALASLDAAALDALLAALRARL